MSGDTTQVGTRRLNRKRPKRLPLILLAVAATGLIALAAIAAAYQFGGDAFGTSAAPSPAASPMDEQGYCALMVPTGGEAADLVGAYASAATRDTVDWAKAEQVSANLKTIRDITTGDARADVETHIAAVDAILDMRRSGFAREYDLEPLRAAGLRMASQCAKYAN